MNVLITGADGQLGKAICEQFSQSAHPLNHREADITDVDAIGEAVRCACPDAVINCAAYTAVDRAESDRAECFSCNASGVENLARVCDDLGVRLVHISTDYVFGGDHGRRTPYLESDAASPVSVYGWSKLHGEQHAEIIAHHLIVRTCGLYGSLRARNFVNAVVDRARRGDPLRVVSDQICSPSLVDDVAGAVKFLVDVDARGIFHVVNGGSITWFAFAREIVDCLGLAVELHEISSRKYGAPAIRPAYSVLDTEKYGRAGGPPLRHCLDALCEHLSVRMST